MEFERDYDVVVVGGGIAGISAALAASRAGVRTALVEKTIMPGGLATAGLIWAYVPLCDGNGNQVTFGIPEELLKLSIKYGPGEIPACWRDESGDKSTARYSVRFSPASFALALDEVLAGPGVEVWLDSLFCVPVMEGNRVTGIEVENKDGRGFIRARCVIDATGDASVAYRAGAKCVDGQNWYTVWALQASLERARQAVETGDGTPLLEVVIVGGGPGGQGAQPGDPGYYGTSAERISVFARQSWEMLRHYYKKAQASGSPAFAKASAFTKVSADKSADKQVAGHAAICGRKNVFPVAIPSMPQFRTIRRIVGRSNLADGQEGQRFDDSIALVADWRKRDSVWETPYGTLVPEKVEGMLVAGRCIASGGDSWEVMRVIPAAAATGQAAGAAAALSVKSNTLPGRIEVTSLQEHLRKNGVIVHLAEVK